MATERALAGESHPMRLCRVPGARARIWGAASHSKCNATCVFVWRSQPKPWRRLAPHSVADWHRLTTWLQRVERMRDVLQAAWAIALAIRDACELRLSWERTGLCRIQGLPYAQFLVRPLVTRMTRAVSPMESIEWG